MASKSKSLRKLERAVKDSDAVLRPQLRRRLRAMERMTRELRAQIRRLHAIRTLVKRTQVPLLEDLKLTRELIKAIQDIDAEIVAAHKAKSPAREKELGRRLRRRDADAGMRLKAIDRRRTKAEEIEKLWTDLQKDLARLSKAE